MQNNIDLIKRQLKKNIQQLIDNGILKEAKYLIEQYKIITKDDVEVYSMDAVVFIMEGKLQEAEEVLKEGLNIDENNFDLNYNLAYVYEQIEKFNLALEYCEKAKISCKDEKLKEQINITINEIKDKYPEAVNDSRFRLVFFVKQGMDSFLGDIIEGLSDDYTTKKIVVTEYKQIDEGMEWADICWFEWCDELVIYGSKLDVAKKKKVVCRLHSYEAFTEYPSKVNWDKVDKVIFIAEHIKNFVSDKFKIHNKKLLVISNGIDINKWKFAERKPGFNVAYVGYINYKKGPMLLLQTFKAIYDRDHRYKLYIAGKFQDDRDVLYFQQMMKEFGIEKNVIYEGWQNNLDEWLEDKNYILCTSILESQNISVMQAMAKGIKPIIHNFVGAKNIYPKEYIWNTIDEAIKILQDKNYNSSEYRKFIEDKYSLEMQIKSLKTLLYKISPRNPGIGTSYKRQIKLDDIDEVVSIYFYGRSGSLFLQSLLDSHPNILMIPGDYIRFYYWFWNSLDPKLNNRLDKNNVMDVFSQIFPFIFNSDSISGVFANSGYGGDFGIRLGFNLMGEKQNKKLGINRDKFICELNKIFEDRKYITRKEFFKAIHIAYFYSLGRKYTFNRQPIIVYFPHIANPDEPIELLRDFPHTKRICMVREPVQSLGSLINTYRRVCNISIEQMLYILRPALYAGITNMEEYLSCAIKLEDIHTKSRPTLEKICKFINIPWNDSLMESTFDGLKWWNGKNSDRINGFNIKVINRKHEDLFTDFDRERLKALLFRKYKTWEYEGIKKGYDALNSELEKPFKFEEYIFYKNNNEKQKGRILIRNLFKEYWKEVNSNIQVKEVNLLK